MTDTFETNEEESTDRERERDNAAAATEETQIHNKEMKENNGTHARIKRGQPREKEQPRIRKHAKRGKEKHRIGKTNETK